MGVANGMALRGMRPIVEIMFGDFLTLAADQIVNMAAKIRYMSGGQVKVPMVLRAPTGGGVQLGARRTVYRYLRLMMPSVLITDDGQRD